MGGDRLTREPATTGGWDYCLVGGGLQASLLVLALRHYQPAARVLVVEKRRQEAATQADAGQTWSCHASDIPGECQVWLRELPFSTWPAYTVRFPRFQREVKLGYCSLRSWDLADHLSEIGSALHSGRESGREAFQLAWRWGVPARRLELRQVELDSGELISARCVIDCRGPDNSGSPAETGFQKFFGWEVELESPWTSDIPLVMDVDSEQGDGFRFIYVLPFSPRRVLLQDTRFSEAAEVDSKEAATRLRQYLSRAGHTQYRVIREEHGLLPMPFAAVRPREPGSLLQAGYRGGWFHAATGYSLPLALQFADVVARVAPGEAAEVVSRLARCHRFRFGFARFLNRLLFRLLPPTARHQVFHNFYRWLPESVIGRFYSHTFTRLDAMRLFFGWPPCPLRVGRFVQSFRS